MAHFDTSLVLEAITNEVLADHETNRQLIELMADTRSNHPMETEANRQQLVWGVLELALRQMARSQHGHDLVVGLIDRLMEESRADLLARYELTAGGFTPEEIEETLTEFPEVAGKYMRYPTRQELDEAGAI
jgi:hypothetical protein